MDTLTIKVVFNVALLITLLPFSYNVQAVTTQPPDTATTEAPAGDPTTPEACPLNRRGPDEGETSIYYEVSAVLPGKQFSDALWDYESVPYIAMSTALREKVNEAMCGRYSGLYNKMGVVSLRPGSVKASFSINLLLGERDTAPLAANIQSTLARSNATKDVEVSKINPDGDSPFTIPIIVIICLGGLTLLMGVIVGCCIWRFHKQGLLTRDPVPKEKNGRNTRRGRQPNHYFSRDFGASSDITNISPPRNNRVYEMQRPV